MCVLDTNSVALNYKARRTGSDIHFSGVQYNFLVWWPCHWRWRPWQMLNARLFGCVFQVQRERHGCRNDLLELLASDDRLRLGLLTRKHSRAHGDGKRVLLSRAVTFWKLIPASIQAPSQRSTSFHKWGTVLLTPDFWNAGGQETFIPPRGGTVWPLEGRAHSLFQFMKLWEIKKPLKMQRGLHCPCRFKLISSWDFIV